MIEQKSCCNADVQDLKGRHFCQEFVKKSFDIIRGDKNRIEGNHNFVIGNFNVVVGDNSTVKGDSCYVEGNNNFVEGNNCRIFGEYNTVKGINNQVSFLQRDPEDLKLIDDLKDFSIDDQKSDFQRKFGSSDDLLEDETPTIFEGGDEYILENGDVSIVSHNTVDTVDTLKNTPSDANPVAEKSKTPETILEHIENILTPKLTPSPLWAKTDEQGDQLAPPSTPRQFLCCICMANCVKMLLTPCNHICLCIGCATKLYSLRIDKKSIVYKIKKPCPICYTLVAGIEKTF